MKISRDNVMYVAIDVLLLPLPQLNLPYTNNHRNTYAVSQQTCFIVTHSFSILGADGSPPGLRNNPNQSASEIPAWL